MHVAPNPKSRYVIACVVVVGFVSSADGAVLSIRFAGGGTEITMAPNQLATIEVVFTGDDWGTQVPHRVTGFDARFDVGRLAAGNGGDYVLDSLTDLWAYVIPGDFPNWNAYNQHIPPMFNRGYFVTAGDPLGDNGPFNVPGEQEVIARIEIRKVGQVVGDTYVVFHAEDPLPALYDGFLQWDHRFGNEPPVDGPRQFELGTGNPGDAGPEYPYHGYETVRPLVIHEVPEPSAGVLVALAGAALLRRRRRKPDCAEESSVTRNWALLVGVAAFVVMPADAAVLSLRFAGGGTEITMAPNQIATIEVVFTGDDWGTQVPHGVTGIDARFDVGTLAAGVGGDYVQDGSTDFSVLDVVAGNFPNWTESRHYFHFNRELFLFAGDPDGISGPANLPGEQHVLAWFVIQKTTTTVIDTYAVFRVDDPLPALYHGAQPWDHRFQYESVDGPRQFEIGTGNPGDADPRFGYHGYETLQPLVIHQVPEPGGLVMLALGGLALRRLRGLKTLPYKLSRIAH